MLMVYRVLTMVYMVLASQRGSQGLIIRDHKIHKPLSNQEVLMEESDDQEPHAF